MPNAWRGKENERVLSSKVTELDEQVVGLKEDVVELTRQKEKFSMREQQREKEWRREVEDQKKELVAEQALSKRWREKSAVDSEARKREEMHYAERVIDWQREEGLLKKEMVVWREIAGKVKEGMDVDLVGDTLRHATSLRISELEAQVDALKIEVVKWKGKAKDQNSTVLQADREEEVEGRNIGVTVVKSASEASGTNKEGDTAGSYWGRCVDTERGQNVKGQNSDTKLAWGKSRSEIIGSKRKSEEVEHPYAKSKRRGSGVAHAFLFGDSQIRPLTTELELVATAHVKGWEVRMRRGGVLANTREMIASEADQMMGVKWAMLLVGGNDMANLEMAENREEKWERRLTDLEEGVKILVSRGVRVVVWLPGLRRDISSRWWNLAAAKMREVAEAAGAVVICSMTENMEHTEDTEVYLDQLVDKLHIKPVELKYILRETLVEMGEDESIRRDKLTCVEVFGKVCWRCGGKDHGGSKCEWRGRCAICDAESHKAAVCWSSVGLCRTCGRKGHIADKCLQKSWGRRR